jgi:uncharacterized protein with HEPN domain
MQPENPDAARLWDILSYSQEIMDTLSGISFREYEKNKTLRLATERRIEIIGEAARNISQAFKDLHPEIPWRKMIAQRHVLAHEYGDIKHEIIYRLATIHIKDLIQTIQPLTPHPPKSKE